MLWLFSCWAATPDDDDDDDGGGGGAERESDNEAFDDDDDDDDDDDLWSASCTCSGGSHDRYASPAQNATITSSSASPYFSARTLPRTSATPSKSVGRSRANDSTCSVDAMECVAVYLV